MQITRINPFTGMQTTLEVPCTPEQLAAWEQGELIQRAMPNVPAELREFVISGITPHEWEQMFRDRDSEDGPELDEDFDAGWRDEPEDPSDPYDMEYDR